MNSGYISLSIAALIPVAAAAVLRVLSERTKFGKLNKKLLQVIYGIIFGGLAILGTEWGIPIDGAQVNCRDAAVLTAGLFFGAPAGIIAGFIGGIERWIAVAWGVGSFTRVACTVSTIIAGLYAAALRKFMFDNKRPGFWLSLAVGVVMEVFHLTMVFITNMDTPLEAMRVVRICTAPMVTANGISVMLSSIFVSLLAGDFSKNRTRKLHISQAVQRWLLLAVVVAFLLTSVFILGLQQKIAANQTESTLKIALDEIEADIRDMSDNNIFTLTKNRQVGEDGFIIIIDADDNILSVSRGVEIKSAIPQDKAEQNKVFEMDINDERYFCTYRKAYGLYIMSVIPKDEALQLRNIALYINTVMEILVFAVLFALIYLLIKKLVVNKIKDVNRSLSKITSGDLNEIVNVRSNAEFESLSDDINSTVDTLKRYIDEASARIDKELALAKDIQASALPNVFPAFPQRKEFDIFALMDPAKEVGGDFYDFYITNSDTLNFLIADVSGKGIPAAMFMMRAKTELKSRTESELPLSDVFTNGNMALCEGNDAGMFVTAWQGGIDLSTGAVRFANAGHNPPLVCHDGVFEYLRSKVGFVLAGMEGVQYKMQELSLAPGDIIFLYTDGVTEATNAEQVLYGEERLKNCINSIKYSDMSELCNAVKADVDAFVGDAPQFDDITMVALKYLG